MSDMGMFGHVPTADEAGAKAFAMDRRLQEQWSWPSYCCGLSDAGVDDARVTHVMIAALNGEFSHNCETAFDGELEEMRDPYEELDDLRELCRDMLTHMRSDGCEGCVCKRRCDAGELEECVEVTDFARRMRKLGIEVGE